MDNRADDRFFSLVRCSKRTLCLWNETTVGFMQQEFNGLKKKESLS